MTFFQLDWPLEPMSDGKNLFFPAKNSKSKKDKKENAPEVDPNGDEIIDEEY